MERNIEALNNLNRVAEAATDELEARNCEDNIAPCPEFDNYGFTKDGRVWKLDLDGKWKQMRCGGDKNGVVWFNVCKNNKAKMKRVAIMMLKTFVGPRQKNMIAEHLDGDRKNNKIENLRWSSDRRRAKRKDANNLPVSKNAAPVRKFEESYLVDPNGTVWSNRGNGIGHCSEWRVVSGSIDQNGYKRHILTKNGKKHTVHLHAILLETFVQEKPDGMVCCHCNGDRLDNRLENIRWDTVQSNVNDTVKHCMSSHGENNPKAKLSEFDIIDIRSMIKSGDSCKTIASQYNVTTETIYRIKNKKSWANVQGDIV